MNFQVFCAMQPFHERWLEASRGPEAAPYAERRARGFWRSRAQAPRTRPRRAAPQAEPDSGAMPAPAYRAPGPARLATRDLEEVERRAAGAAGLRAAGAGLPAGR